MTNEEMKKQFAKLLSSWDDDFFPTKDEIYHTKVVLTKGKFVLEHLQMLSDEEIGEITKTHIYDKNDGQSLFKEWFDNASTSQIEDLFKLIYDRLN